MKKRKKYALALKSLFAKYIRIEFLLVFLIGFLWKLPIEAANRDSIVIEGDYLFYSYDYNYIYGRGNIRVSMGNIKIIAQAFELDINDRNAIFYRQCRVENESISYSGDCVDLEIEKVAMRVRTFSDKINSVVLPATLESTFVFSEFVPVSLQELKTSFAYFIGKKFVLKKDFSVYGYKATAFFEGMQSVSFKKLRLDKGMAEKQKKPFSVDKIWYYSSQGIVFNGSMNFDGKIKKRTFLSSTMLETQYDIFGTTGNTPKGRLYLNSKQELEMLKNLNLRFNFNWITQNMISGSFVISQKIGSFLNNEWIAEYSKPYSRKEELWFRWRSSATLKSAGNLLLNLSYAKMGQNVLDLSYNNQFFRKLNLTLRHNQSKLILNPDTINKISNSSVSVSYSAKLFNLSADYSLNKDLFHGQSQVNPTLRLQVVPFKLYGGLLRVNVNSMVMFNYMKKGNFREDTFRSNSAISLESEELSLTPGTQFSVSMALEQYLDKNPQNRYTSLGCIFRGKHKLGKIADMEFIYNFQERRETASWFIQGTHSQDWNLVLRSSEKNMKRVTGWVSLSMDTKRGRLTTGFADLSVLLIKNWRFQTQINYDFLFRRVNYDLFLLRKAGRFVIRLSYRSLSKQFLFEVLPQ